MKQFAFDVQRVFRMISEVKVAYFLCNSFSLPMMYLIYNDTIYGVTLIIYKKVGDFKNFFYF